MRRSIGCPCPAEPAMSFRVSVDIGGTCTDVVVASDSGG